MRQPLCLLDAFFISCFKKWSRFSSVCSSLSVVIDIKGGVMELIEAAYKDVDDFISFPSSVVLAFLPAYFR